MEQSHSRIPAVSVLLCPTAAVGQCAQPGLSVSAPSFETARRELETAPLSRRDSRSLVVRTVTCLFSALSCMQRHFREHLEAQDTPIHQGRLAWISRRGPAFSSQGGVASYSISSCSSAPSAHTGAGLLELAAPGKEQRRIQTAIQLLSGRNYLLSRSARDGSAGTRAGVWFGSLFRFITILLSVLFCYFPPCVTCSVTLGRGTRCDPSQGLWVPV